MIHQSKAMAALVRAARSLLGWTQAELAVKADLSRKTVADFEQGKRSARNGTMRRLEFALRAAGVTFLPKGVTL